MCATGVFVGRHYKKQNKNADQNAIYVIKNSVLVRFFGIEFTRITQRLCIFRNYDI